MAIYDCFMFFDEIEILKLRLEMLNPVVDKFVIVELNKTFRGVDKPYIFLEHKNEFSKYLDKIIYINPDEIPSYKGENDWTIEYFARNSLTKGLNNCDDDDLIIISDLDEIPNPEIFIYPDTFKYSKFPDRSTKKIIKNIIKNKSWWILKPMHKWIDLLEYTPVACQQDLYYYFLNCKCDTKWYGPVICKYKNLTTAQYLRKNRTSIPYIKNAGWHLSYFGGVESIKKKLKAIIDDRKEIMQITDNYCNDDEYINYCLKNNIDLYQRNNVIFRYLNYDEINFPNKKVINNNHPSFFRNFD